MLKSAIMTELDEILATLESQVDGATAAAVGSMDGLVVEQSGSQAHLLPAFVAELTNVLNASRAALTQRLSAGGLNELILSAESQVAYVRVLNQDLFCVILMEAGGNLGKARLYSGFAGKRILEALA